MDNVFRSVIVCLAFLLRKFAVFAYHMINPYIFVTVYPTIAILCTIIICFHVISSYGIILYCYLERFSFFLQVSFFKKYPVDHEINSWMMSLEVSITSLKVEYWNKKEIVFSLSLSLSLYIYIYIYIVCVCAHVCIHLPTPLYGQTETQCQLLAEFSFS